MLANKGNNSGSTEKVTASCSDITDKVYTKLTALNLMELEKSNRLSLNEKVNNYLQNQS
jgi:hypothetical protein